MAKHGVYRDLHQVLRVFTIAFSLVLFMGLLSVWPVGLWLLRLLSFCWLVWSNFNVIVFVLDYTWCFFKKQDKQTNNNQKLSRLKERKDSWPNPLKSTRSSDAGLQLTGLQRHLKPLLCFMLRKSSEVSPCHSSKLAHLRTFSPLPTP